LCFYLKEEEDRFAESVIQSDVPSRSLACGGLSWLTKRRTVLSAAQHPCKMRAVFATAFYVRRREPVLLQAEQKELFVRLARRSQTETINEAK
jgi:hypothetical protein